MFQRLYAMGLVALFAALAPLVVGCGGGGSAGGGGDSSIARPSYSFSRGTGEASQASDLVSAAHMIDYPTGQDILDIVDGDTPQAVLDTLDYSDTLADYYPLAAPAAAAVRGGNDASCLQVKSELAVSRLAGLLVRRYRHGARAPQTIDFTSTHGIHWTGTYNDTQTATSGSTSLNVTGTRGALQIAMTITANFSENLAMTQGSYSDAYTLTVTNTVPGSGGATPVSITAEGTGSGGYTVVSPSSWTDTQKLSSRYKRTVDGHVIWESTTKLDSSFGTTGYTFAYDANTLQFALDTYWVYAIVKLKADNSSYNYRFTLDASDGYRLTFNGENGSLTDNTGNELATLTLGYDEFYNSVILVDFIPRINDAGVPDTSFALHQSPE